MANDRSKARSARLGRTLRAYVPPSLSGGVRVACQDASKWFRHARHREVSVYVCLVGICVRLDGWCVRLGLLPALHLPVGVRASDLFTSRFHARTQAYDRILVDAPCGSERHLIQQQQQEKGNGEETDGGGPGLLRDWGPGRTKQLANAQRALLSSALRCVLLGFSGPSTVDGEVGFDDAPFPTAVHPIHVNTTTHP